ncbi:hypothetical protein ACFL1X_10630 [Candidatus Hydrogenedentota bacterium]
MKNTHTRLNCLKNHAAHMAVLTLGIFGLCFVSISGTASADWSEPALLDPAGAADSDGDGHVNMAIDGSGKIHIVWSGDLRENNRGNIFYSVYNGASWAAPTQLNNGGIDPYCTSACIAVGNSGVLHAAWATHPGDESDIKYTFNDGGGWSVPALIDPGQATDSGGDHSPRFTVDGSGRIHCVWYSGEDLNGAGTDWDIFYSVNGGSGWSSPILVNRNGTADSGYDIRPNLVVDAYDVLHAVWQSDEDLNGAGTDSDMFYAVNDGSGWSAPTLVNTNGTTDTGGDLGAYLAVDGSGVLHAVWASEEDLNGAGTDVDIFHAVNSGSGWSAPTMLNPAGKRDSDDDLPTDIMIDGSGNIHVLWTSTEDLQGTDTDIDIFHSINDGPGWSTPFLVNLNGTTGSGNDRDARIVVTGSGSLLAVWSSNDDLGGTIGTDSDLLFAVHKSVKLESIGRKCGEAGKTLVFTVRALSFDGTPPGLSCSNIPAGASFVDNGDGSGTFTWATESVEPGAYDNVHFEATHGGETDSEDIAIYVITGAVVPAMNAWALVCLAALLGLVGLRTCLRSVSCEREDPS